MNSVLVDDVFDNLPSTWTVAAKSDRVVTAKPPNWTPRVPLTLVFTSEEDDTVTLEVTFGITKFYSNRQPSVLAAVLDFYEQVPTGFDTYALDVWDGLAWTAQELAKELMAAPNRVLSVETQDGFKRLRHEGQIAAFRLVYGGDGGAKE